MKTNYCRADIEHAVTLGRKFPHLTPTEVFLLCHVCLRLSRKAERLARLATKRSAGGTPWSSEAWADNSTKLRREALRELESFRIPGANVEIRRETPAFVLIHR